MGRNGVGKTSLMRAIVGQQPIRSGASSGRTRTSRACRPTSGRRAAIAFVPQGARSFPLLTVEENLQTGFAALPRALRHVPDEIFELFPVLRDMLARRGGDLSGGQQQQLAIARALVTRPRLLVLDEPTEGIQPSIIKDIERVIRLLVSRGNLAILLVEQYFEFARDLADSYAVMDRGEIVVAGKGYGDGGSGCASSPHRLRPSRGADPRRGQDRVPRRRRRHAAGAALPARAVAGAVSGGRRERPDHRRPRHHYRRAGRRRPAGRTGRGGERARPCWSPRQAAEKVYRSLGPRCRVEVDLSAAAGSWLEWLPHETILFEGARLDRTTRIEHAPGARVLAGEMLVFGRSAHGEMLTHGCFRDAWEVRRQGRLVWADALAAAGDLAPVLAAPACLAGAAALATAVYVGDGVDDALAYARDLTAGPAAGDMAIAVTCVAGVLVCRWLGRDARALRAAFGRFWAAFRHRLGGLPPVLPRVWSV